MTLDPVAGRKSDPNWGMEFDVNGLEVLSCDECLELLASQKVGRIALSSRGLLVVLPVNYVLIDEQIVIRTRRGTNLALATRNSIIAFEVDKIDESGQGWSVTIRGLARELCESPELTAARNAPLTKWLDPMKSRHVAVTIDTMSGRRVTFGLDGESLLETRDQDDPSSLNRRA